MVGELHTWHDMHITKCNYNWSLHDDPCGLVGNRYFFTQSLGRQRRGRPKTAAAAAGTQLWVGISVRCGKQASLSFLGKFMHSSDGRAESLTSQPSPRQVAWPTTTNDTLEDTRKDLSYASLRKTREYTWQCTQLALSGFGTVCVHNFESQVDQLRKKFSGNRPHKRDGTASLSSPRVRFSVGMSVCVWCVLVLHAPGATECTTNERNVQTKWPDMYTYMRDHQGFLIISH